MGCVLYFWVWVKYMNVFYIGYEIEDYGIFVLLFIKIDIFCFGWFGE